MNKIYSTEQWQRDGEFKAQPGQEITEQIYEEMFNCLPPRRLPRAKAKQALQDYDIPVHAGFLMGEPHSTGKTGPLFLAFGKNDYGKGPHYFYLGLSEPIKNIPDGSYYFMDCLNSFVNNGLFPAEEFDGDADAIQQAANYEATLYKYKYKYGERISSRVLYQPRFM